jgi:hypothetical protein
MQAVPIEDLPREDYAVQTAGAEKNLSSSRFVVGVRGKEGQPRLQPPARLAEIEER